MSVDKYTERLPASDSERVKPDAKRLVGALRAIGYKFNQAIADLVDNSINASASTVIIRFITSGNKLSALAIVDDGKGMSKKDISEAMRFGSRDRNLLLAEVRDYTISGPRNPAVVCFSSPLSSLTAISSPHPFCFLSTTHNLP